MYCIPRQFKFKFKKKTKTSLNFLQIHKRNLEAGTKPSHSFKEKEREFIKVNKMEKTKQDAH
jgi:hypothetical protein